MAKTYLKGKQLMKQSFQKIGLIARAMSQTLTQSLLKTLAIYLQSMGRSVFIASNDFSGDFDACGTLLDEKTFCQTVDLVIVMGGDGTLLSAARLLAPYQIPLMGINQGRFGFMTDVTSDDMLRAVHAVLQGGFTDEARQLIVATIERNQKTIAQGIALNDIVFSRGGMGHMIEFEVFVDQQFVYTQRSDGLIVTTPTGSTAYSLAAGGPILHSTLPAFALVPVSPHSMSYRPIVINDHAVIEFVLTRGVDACVHFDGQSHTDLLPMDHVVIQRYKHALKLIHPTGYRYYDTLRRKLHWGKQLTVE